MRFGLMYRTQLYSPDVVIGREAPGFPPIAVGLVGKIVRMYLSKSSHEAFYVTQAGPYRYPSTEEEIRVAYEVVSEMHDKTEVDLGEYDLNGQFCFVPYD